MKTPPEKSGGFSQVETPSALYFSGSQGNLEGHFFCAYGLHILVEKKVLSVLTPNERKQGIIGQNMRSKESPKTL